MTIKYRLYFTANMAINLVIGHKRENWLFRKKTNQQQLVSWECLYYLDTAIIYLRLQY